MRKILALMFTVLLLFSGTAVADFITLNWDLPTTRTDGSTLTLGELGGYDIQCGDTPGGPYPNTHEVIEGDYTQYADTTNKLAPADFTEVYCRMRTYDQSGERGPWSAEASLLNVKHSPPGNLNITVTTE